MPIPDAILNQMKCCLNNDDHFAIDPIVLKCGASACKQCINDSKDSIFSCYSCNGKHEKKIFIDSPVSKLAQSLVHTFMGDMFECVETKLKEATDIFKSLFIFKHYRIIAYYKGVL